MKEFLQKIEHEDKKGLNTSILQYFNIDDSVRDIFYGNYTTIFKHTCL